MHRLGREEGLVRRDDHIGEEQQPRQRVVVDDRVRPVFVEVVAFLLVDVQPRRADLLAFERFDQRFGLDKLSAAGVDDHHAAFHAGDRGLVDEVLRLVGERAVERDDVRTAVEFVERDVGDARLAGENAVGVGVVGQNFHAESEQDADDDAGDLARADHPDGLAVHIESHESLQREVAVARAPACARDLAVEREHHRHRVLRDGMGRIGGYAHDGDVEGPRGFQVDVVVTGTAQRQQSHAVACQFAHHFGVGRIVDEDTRRLRAVRGDDRLTAEMAFEIAEFESEIAVQCVERLLFVGLRPEEGDDGFHGSCVLSCCSNVKRCRQITCRSLKIGVSEPKSRSDVRTVDKIAGRMARSSFISWVCSAEKRFGYAGTACYRPDKKITATRFSGRGDFRRYSFRGISDGRYLISIWCETGAVGVTSFLGRSIVSTPFSTLAEIFWRSTSSGSEKLCWNEV